MQFCTSGTRGSQSLGILQTWNSEIRFLDRRFYLEKKGGDRQPSADLLSSSHNAETPPSPEQSNARGAVVVNKLSRIRSVSILHNLKVFSSSSWVKKIIIHRVPRYTRVF